MTHSFADKLIATLAHLALVALCGIISEDSLFVVGPAAMILIQRTWCGSQPVATGTDSRVLQAWIVRILRCLPNGLSTRTREFAPHQQNTEENGGATGHPQQTSSGV